MSTVPTSHLLGRRGLSAAEWIGGVVGVILGFVLPAIAVLMAAAVSASIAPDAAATPPPDEEVIAARFVQLGRDFQDELPNRIVPQAATAPPDSVALSDNPDERPEPEEQRERPDEALERNIDNLLDSVEAFAEEVEAREREGNPDGIEEGTETEAQAGDIYAGQLYAFFRRGWTVPTTISEEEKRGLRIEVTVTVAENLQIVSYRLRGSSSNPDFDQSVRAQIDRMRENNVEIPEPPLAVRPNYVPSFTLRFNGRNARSAD